MLPFVDLFVIDPAPGAKVAAKNGSSMALRLAISAVGWRRQH